MRVHNFLPLMVTSAVLGLSCMEAQATEVTVVSSRGSVSVTQNDHLVPISASAHLTLPAQIRTGADGVIDLKDNSSLVHIGPNSTVAIPDSGPSGNFVDRYLQSAGSALYNIQARHGRPMSVETPYLVSVVKGTVFTVSVEDDATSVTLMEGSLEVAAPDVSQHVLLKPNQSIRHRPGEASLMVSPARAESQISRKGSADDRAPLADESSSSQVAFVTRDLAEVGATVSAVHAIPTSSLSAGSARSPETHTGSSGGGGMAGSSGSGSVAGSSGSGSVAGSTGSGSPPSSGGSPGAGGTGGAGATSSGTNGPGTTSSASSSGSSSPPGSGSGTSTGTTSGTSTSTTSGSTSTSTGGSTSDPGSSNTAGSGGSDTSGSTGAVVGCNGKTNGTGLGRCIGHGKH